MKVLKRSRLFILLLLIPCSFLLIDCHNNNSATDKEEKVPAVEQTGVETGEAETAVEGEEKQQEKKYLYDWPFFRGPAMDGIAREDSWLPARLDDEDCIKWDKNIGFGYAGITIFQDRLFTMGLKKIAGNNKEGNDSIYCFNVETGEEIWRRSYVCTIGMHPGPRTAPTIYKGYVYTLSRDGDFYCLDYSTGSVVWYHDIVSEYKAEIPRFGFSAAPVVEDELIIINARVHGMAFHRETGELVWMSPVGKCGYAVIPVFTWNNKRYAAVFSDNALFIVDALTGEKVCSFPWKTYSGCNVGFPIIFDNRIFISSSYNYGCALLEFTDEMTLSVLWRNKVMKHHMSAGVLVDGIYYGNDGFFNKGKGSFKAIDILTGKEKWIKEDGVGSVVGVGNKLILLTTKGKLTIAKLTAEAYQPVISKTLGKGTWFTPPTFCRGYLFVRNREGRFLCLDLNKQGGRSGQ